MTEYVCYSKKCTEHCRFCAPDSNVESYWGDNIDIKCPKGFNVRWVKGDYFSRFEKGRLYYDPTTDTIYEVEGVFDNFIATHKWDDPEERKNIFYHTSVLEERHKRCLYGVEMEKLVGKVVYLPDASYHLVTDCAYDASMGYYVVIAGKKYTAEELIDNDIRMLDGKPLYAIEDKVNYED